MNSISLLREQRINCVFCITKNYFPYYFVLRKFALSEKYNSAVIDAICGINHRASEGSRHETRKRKARGKEAPSD